MQEQLDIEFAKDKEVEELKKELENVNLIIMKNVGKAFIIIFGFSLLTLLSVGIPIFGIMIIMNFQMNIKYVTFPETFLEECNITMINRSLDLTYSNCTTVKFIALKHNWIYCVIGVFIFFIGLCATGGSLMGFGLLCEMKDGCGKEIKK
jgi:hypothetical protein